MTSTTSCDELGTSVADRKWRRAADGRGEAHLVPAVVARRVGGHGEQVGEHLAGPWRRRRARARPAPAGSRPRRSARKYTVASLVTPSGVVELVVVVDDDEEVLEQVAGGDGLVVGRHRARAQQRGDGHQRGEDGRATAGCPGGLMRDPPRRRRCSSSTRGRAITNRAPPPGASSTSTSPPWRRTCSATRARPRPTPVPIASPVRGAGPVEPLEDAVAVLVRHALSRVVDHDLHRRRRRRRASPGSGPSPYLVALPSRLATTRAMRRLSSAVTTSPNSGSTIDARGR